MPVVTLQEAIREANVRLDSGRLAEAETLCREILKVVPSQPDAIHILGVIACQVGKFETALDLLQRAIAATPAVGMLHNSLGITFWFLRRPREAAAALRAAVALEPKLAEAWNNLGNVLNDLGEWDEAERACRTAIALRPAYAEAHNNLGNTFTGKVDADAAEAAYRTAIAALPSYAIAHSNLGNVLRYQRRPDEAIASYREALRLQPAYVDAANNLANALKDVGRLDEAINLLRWCLEKRPSDELVHSNLVYSLHFHEASDRATVREALAEWNRRHIEPLRHRRAPLANVRDPDRRLRVGYLSPDLWAHAISFFIVPLLEAHDPEQVEVYCYSNLGKNDEVTERIRRSAAQWRDVGSLTDDELAECVRADGVDVLVELALHSSHHRLLALARQPAPVQVSWLAYPGGSGVETIGYRLTDAHIDPPEWVGEGDVSEPLRLPDSWCVYAPIAQFPDVAERSGGFVTFGSVNNFAKVSPASLQCWAEILAAVPDSRLLITCPQGESRARLLEFMSSRGIDGERIEFADWGGWEHYVSVLSRIDIGLDPFPCNGMTTTCHLLWMGVPVVTLCGETQVARAGASLLSTVGLGEWVADSRETYVAKAVALARDPRRLHELRGTMRSRMAASPLMDAPRFARNVEGAFRKIWRDWCASGAQRGVTGQ